MILKILLAHNNMAYLLWTLTKEFDFALEYAEKAIAINPKGIFWHTLAEVYYYGFSDKTKTMEVLLMGKKADESFSAGDELIKVMEAGN